MEVKRCGMSPAFGMKAGTSTDGAVAIAGISRISTKLATALQCGFDKFELQTARKAGEISVTNVMLNQGKNPSLVLAFNHLNPGAAAIPKTLTIGEFNIAGSRTADLNNILRNPNSGAIQGFKDAVAQGLAEVAK